MTAYALGCVGFTVAFLAYCIGAVRLLDRLASRRIRRAVNEALDNGDARTLRAVVEQETYRSRVAVPRQLTGRTR